MVADRASGFIGAGKTVVKSACKHFCLYGAHIPAGTQQALVCKVHLLIGGIGVWWHLLTCVLVLCSVLWKI